MLLIPNINTVSTIRLGSKLKSAVKSAKEAIKKKLTIFKNVDLNKSLKWIEKQFLIFTLGYDGYARKQIKKKMKERAPIITARNIYENRLKHSLKCLDYIKDNCSKEELSIIQESIKYLTKKENRIIRLRYDAHKICERLKREKYANIEQLKEKLKEGLKRELAEYLSKQCIKILRQDGKIIYEFDENLAKKILLENKRMSDALDYFNIIDKDIKDILESAKNKIHAQSKISEFNRKFKSKNSISEKIYNIYKGRKYSFVEEIVQKNNTNNKNIYENLKRKVLETKLKIWAKNNFRVSLTNTKILHNYFSQ